MLLHIGFKIFVAFLQINQNLEKWYWKPVNSNLYVCDDIKLLTNR